MLAVSAPAVAGETRVAQFNWAAASSNQSAAAGGAGTLASPHPVSGAFSTITTVDDARRAFDQLSGEIHASAKGVMAEESRFVRSASIDRIRAAFNTIAAAQNNPDLALPDRIQEGPTLGVKSGGPVVAPASTEKIALWSQSIGSWGSTQANGNAAGLSRSSGGVLAGVDAQLSDKWRVGVLGGYSSTRFDVSDRVSSGKSDNYHVGLYAGTPWHGFGLRGGATHTWHNTVINRSVAFGSFAESLTGAYQARSAQVFGEVGYGIQAGKIGVEPFANVAYVNVQTDGFSEAGGAAALSAHSSSTGVTYATLGLRSSGAFQLGGVATTVTGTVQRYALGETVPFATMCLNGGAPFTVAGAPVGKDALMFDAGIDVAVSKKGKLGVTYGGQIADGSNDQFVKGNLALGF